MTNQEIINLMSQAEEERKEDIATLKEVVASGNSDPANYDSLKMVIIERYNAKMEVLEAIGKLNGQANTEERSEAVTGQDWTVVIV